MKRQWDMKDRWEARGNNPVSVAIFPGPTWNLLGAISLTIQREVIQCVLSSITQFSSQSSLEVGGEHYDRKIFKLLHSDNSDINLLQIKWKSLTLCREVMRENHSQILKNEGISKYDVRT